MSTPPAKTSVAIPALVAGLLIVVALVRTMWVLHFGQECIIGAAIGAALFVALVAGVVAAR